MSNMQPLTKELVRRPDLWQLSMRLADDAVDVVLYSPVENNSLLYRQIPLEAEGELKLKALEEAVYDNPLLLSEFGRISIVVDTARVLPIPAGDETFEDKETLFEAAFPGFDGVIYENETGSRNASLLFGVDNDLSAFIERTFFGARIYHHLTPLCRYFVAMARRANGARVYANLRDTAVDLVAVDHGKVLMLNTMEFKTDVDAIYYILACYHVAGLNMVETELLVAGVSDVRDRVVPVLRNYIGSVMPVIFPSTMFKAGKDAMKAPFDLIVLPLCE